MASQTRPRHLCFRSTERNGGVKACAASVRAGVSSAYSTLGNHSTGRVNAVGPRRHFALIAVLVGLATGFTGAAQQRALDQANGLELQGHFAEAASALQAGLDTKDQTAQQRGQIEFELDRLRRIKLDFPYTEALLFDDLKKSVKDLTRREFEQWVQEGRFDSREIDGQRYFMAASVSNLFFRYPELYAR